MTLLTWVVFGLLAATGWILYLWLVEDHHMPFGQSISAGDWMLAFIFMTVGPLGLVAVTVLITLDRLANR